MNNNAGYQPAGQTTVVLVNPSRYRGPQFLQQGFRVGGVAIGLSCVVCLGLFGGFFILSSTIMLATANYDDEFWDHFDRDQDPTVVVGSIFLTIGILLVAAAVGVALYSRKKYRTLQSDGTTNPGRVINPPPSGPAQPLAAGYPGQPQVAPYNVQPQQTGYGQPQPVGFGQPQPYGYPGQPQLAGYPVQPQPAGYPTQQPTYPPPTSSYPGPPDPYPQPSGGFATQPDAPYPEKMNVSNMASEYSPPPPTVPDTSVQPPPYQP